MTGPGPWNRALALALVTAVIGLVEPAPAAASDPETPVFAITFPVVGPTTYHSSFGDCRDGCERAHSGVDILTNGWKGVPVVAAHSGRVVSITRNSPLSGVSVAIRARGGWETRYVHLNNDTPGTDNGYGNGIVPGLEVGDVVRAGQLIGWVGDSGNAEETVPHLHFEIRRRGGEAIDPYPSLRKAARIDFRRIGGADAAEIAVRASQMAYPEGAHMVVITPTAALPGWLHGDDPPRLAGPLLLATPDALPEVTRQELVRLAPEVIVIAGDSTEVGRDVERRLQELARIVERLAPVEPAATFPVPVAAAAERATPFTVHLLDDGRRLRRSAAAPLAELADLTPIIRLAVATRPASGIGIDVDAAPRTTAEGVLHFATGAGFVTTTAQRDRPNGSGIDEPLPVGEGEMVVITRRQATAPTLTYLAGLATAPPAPLWR